jgi:hypothetical protein
MALPTNKEVVPFRNVVHEVLKRDGVDTQLIGLATDLVAFLNDRLKQAWHHEFWPQTMRVARKHYHQTFCLGQQYEEGDILYYNDNYYICTEATSASPQSDAVRWVITNDYEKIIPMWQNGPTLLDKGSDVMHRIYSVSMRNPNRSYTPGYIDYELRHNGLAVSDLAPAEVWVKYQIEPEEYTLQPLEDDRVYIPEVPIGSQARKADVVYDQVTGHCYKAKQNASAENLFTDNEFWERIPFPKFLERYVVHGAYADWLASEGQTNKSETEDNYANKLLQDLMDMYAPQDQVNQRVSFSRQ